MNSEERPVDNPIREADPASRLDPRRWHWTALAVLAFGVISLGMLLGQDGLHKRLILRDTNRAYAVHDLLIALTTVHLWTEEHVTGDEVDLEEIARALDTARDLADALLDRTEGARLTYRIEPLVSETLRGSMRLVREHELAFRALSFERQERYLRGEPVGIGSEFDVEYDRVYREFFGSARALETSLEERQALNRGRARILFRAIFTSWSLIVVLAVAGLWSLERRRTRVEAALRERELQLLQSQKMESVGRLAGGIAHDINNYLGAILSQAELVRLKTGGSASRHVEAIGRSVGKASALITQLLAFSRRQPVQPVVLNLNRVIEDNVATMLDGLIGEDVVTETRLHADLGNVKIDPSQIERVIVNLVVNAREAMPSGGKLSIETADRTLETEAADLTPPVPSGDYVMLAVSDTGSGIAPEIREKIFEPFFTTKSVTHNSGLGLSTVHGIVEQSGGGVSLESDAGRGTTFRVYLPRSAEPAAVPEPRSSDPAEPLHGRGRILLVEDNEDLRESTRSMLERFGYEVIVASTGEEALAAFDERGSEIDLVMTDVVMPGMSGKRLADLIRERDPSSRVLFVSGYTDDVILKHGIREGEVDFLPKPVSAETLARKIRQLLGGSRES